MANTRIVLGWAALAAGCFLWTDRGHVVAATGGSITGISVCGAGPVASTSCPAGTFDTQQIVLAPDGSGRSLNRWNVPGAVDEHSTVFAPTMLGANNDYLFFLATGTTPHSTAPGSPTLVHGAAIGVTVMSGGKGPDNAGQWTMRFADGYGAFDADGNVGPVFQSPAEQGQCPVLADRTFDVIYAAPGSVVVDPTSPPGSLLMWYEGTNSCGPLGSLIALGIATSADYGHNWPTYAGTPSFLFTPLPYQNATQGPDVPPDTGAFGSQVCIGDDCESAKPSPGYGRYPVLRPPIGQDTRDSQPAAFVDNVSGGSPIYVYSVHDYEPSARLSDGRKKDLAIARAALNGGSGPLSFEKWNGQPCSTTAPCWAGPGAHKLVNDAPEFQILKDSTDFVHCEDVGQERTSPSLSYFPATGQYLLTFVCRSPGDPALGADQPAAVTGVAWFFSTSPDLSDPNQWSTPTEILGSWNVFSSPDFYNGWYPTFMSLAEQPSWLKARGYAFYLWGCEGGDCGGRQFTSRKFFIQTTDNAYSRRPVTTITGPTSSINLAGSATFTFKSNEPGSAFECSLDGSAFTSCHSGVTYVLTPGKNVFRVKATNPFGIAGRPATFDIDYVLGLGGGVK